MNVLLGSMMCTCITSDMQLPAVLLRCVAWNYYRVQITSHRAHGVILTAGLQDSAEFGRIGRYYATESMLVWDDKEQKYVADATPSYGKVSLEQFFEHAVKEGLAGQELGDAAIF